MPSERVFGLLNGGRAQIATWGTRPPESRTTTLVPCNLSARDLAGQWYQVDEAEPAGFFRSPSPAAKPWKPQTGASLPQFSVAAPLSLRASSRAFLRVLSSGAPELAWVLENCKEVALESPLHEIPGIPRENVSRGTRLVLLSRADPSDPYACLRANGQFGSIRAPELQMTGDGAKTVAALHRFRLEPDRRQILRT